MSENNDRPGDDEPRTVFSPQPPSGGQPVPDPASTAQTTGSWTAGPQETALPGSIQIPAAPGEPREVREGDVLNHLYQVRRFIARGGMGQVFEGVNINNDDERVAIKVILPHLARDPNVLAMFRKEARTLTRLSHPALVQYRTLAMEPQLGVFYIVTEYIDGRNLSDVLATIEANPAQIRALIRTLAEGLAVAHSLGAIHRDISPDNVMLEGGRLDKAKVIDFGIAKDLDAGSQTIVGDGFAGKLNYVAPEQLGDFGREIGSWTDVYSLGLTALALINKRDVNMGGSLVDAVDKRRAGPDLSNAPAELQPVLEAMLQADPAKRLRTMEQVIDALGDRSGRTTFMPLPPKLSPGEAMDRSKVVVVKAGPTGSASDGKQRKLLIGAGVAAVVVALGGLGFALSSGNDAPPESGAQGVAATAPGDPLKTAQAALDQGLPTVTCSWLDVSDLQVQGNDVALAVKGVAGRPVEAQNAIGKLLTDKGLRAASIDFSDVSQIGSSDCGPIEAFRQIRGNGVSALSVAQMKWELSPLPADDPEAGKPGVKAVINFDLKKVDGDVALIGLEDSGNMSFNPQWSRDALIPVDASQQLFRYEVVTTHVGWTGLFLLYGKGPFDPSLLNGLPGSRGADWPQRFLAEAKAKGWKSDMVWYKTVNDKPD